MKISNIIKHFNIITKHRFLVFKLCCRAGIPFRGFIHDLSKYSFTEFGESIHYYTGTCSPIELCRRQNGYSRAWLHHKGRNKHHFEYWVDLDAPEKTPVIPYKYTVEMICDTLAAGLTYKGKGWYPSYQLEYFHTSTPKQYINKKIQNVLEEVYEQVAQKGIHKTVTKKNLKSIYDKYVNS